MRVAAAAYASVKWTASLVDVTVRLVPGSVAYCTCWTQVLHVSALVTQLEGSQRYIQATFKWICTSLLRLESSLTMTSHGSITGSHAVSMGL